MSSNAKGGRLEGGALTGDVIDSSRNVYSGGRSGAGVGLQQYFTPPEVGGLLAQLFDPSVPTLDPTAGDGALLDWLATAGRYGIEIDADQVDHGDYQAIRSDIQKAYPLLRQTGARWPQLAVNPPFGLTWSFPGIGDGKDGSSTLRAFQIIPRLLTDNGAALFICGRDRFDREIARLPEAQAIWAKIEVEDLFDEVKLPCVICLMVGPKAAEDRQQAGHTGWYERKVTRSEFAGLADELIEERERRTDTLRIDGRYAAGQIRATWQAVKDELARRDTGYERKGFDLSLAGSTLRVRLNEIAKVSLASRGYQQSTSSTVSTGWRCHGRRSTNATGRRSRATTTTTS